MNLQVNENIELESLSFSHAKEIFQEIDKHREALRQWLPFVEFTKSEEDSKEFVEFSNSTGDEIFAIRYKGLFAGLVGIKDIDYSSNKGELGYWVSPKFQNRGITTSSCKRLIEYFFVELNLNRLQIRIADGNSKSLRVAEKLHFIHEGIQREGELLDSGYVDLHVFSILKKETIFCKHQNN